MSGTRSPGEVLHLPVRVYYEDTDAAGVVYYANYLRYMERARTEWLAALGFDLVRMENGDGVVFVVHRVEIDFRAPARLGDRLDATVALAELQRARMVLLQDVLRDGEALTRAKVAIACLKRASFRPVRFPAALHARLASLL